MKKGFFAKINVFLMVLVIVFSNCGMVFAGIGEPPEVNAVSAILIELQRGQLLFQKNSTAPLHIASANKIMTALLAIEKSGQKLDTQITVSKNVVDIDGSKVNLEVGGKYSVEDLVYTIILTSGNDSAIALAEYVAGDVQTFVELMNQKASELKLSDTYFTNQTGLFDEQQHTTAADLVVLMKYALSNPSFDAIFSSQAKLWNNQENTEILTNSNSLFWSYDGIDGGKTGYNEIERQSAISTVTRNNMRLICIVLDSSEASVYEDSVKVLDYGYNNFKKGILQQKDKIVETIEVEEKEINLVSPIDIYYTFPIGEGYIKDVEFKLKKNIELPVLKTDIIGNMKYILEDDTEITVDLYPSDDVYSSVDMFSSLFKAMEEYKDITILLCVLAGIEIFLLILKLARWIVNVVSRLILKMKKA